MNRKPTARRRRAAPAAVAGILVLTACAGSPAAEPAAPDPAASPADTAAPPPEPESQPEPRWIHVDPGAGFLDLFDSLSAAEQSCIRDALDEDEFGAVMEERVRDVYDTDPGGLGPTFDCLTPDAVRSLEIAFLDAALQEALGLGELSRDQVSCLRDRLATGDGLFLRPGLDEVTLFLDSFEVLAHCVPDALLIGMLPAMGAPELEELSGEQRSCLHDWLRTIEFVPRPGEEAAMVGAYVSGLARCLPDVVLAEVFWSLDVEMEDLSEQELSCARRWLSDVDRDVLVAAFFGEYFPEGLVDCL